MNPIIEEPQLISDSNEKEKPTLVQEDDQKNVGSGHVKAGGDDDMPESLHDSTLLAEEIKDKKESLGSLPNDAGSTQKSLIE